MIDPAHKGHAASFEEGELPEPRLPARQGYGYVIEGKSPGGMSPSPGGKGRLGFSATPRHDDAVFPSAPHSRRALRGRRS
jgi:hypothetical protein